MAGNRFFHINRGLTLVTGVILRTFESIITEHIICADKLVLAPNFYYSLATVCYVLTKSFNFWEHGILIVNNHTGNLGADTLDRIPQAGSLGGQAMHRRIVSPAPTKLCLWQAPSSKLWTGETDMEIGDLNLTLYTLNFASPDPSI